MIPDQTKAVFTITEVEIDTRTVHVKDKSGGELKANFRQQGGLFLVPEVGDIWLGQRIGWQWHLESRLDSPAQHDHLVALQPGDGRIDLSGTLSMSLEALQINSQPLGVQTRDILSANGSVTSWTLTGPPVHQHTIMAFENGLLVDPTTITISGRVITFRVAPASGTLVVYYQRLSGVITDDAAVASGMAVISGTDTKTP